MRRKTARPLRVDLPSGVLSQALFRGSPSKGAQRTQSVDAGTPTKLPRPLCQQKPGVVDEHVPKQEVDGNRRRANPWDIPCSNSHCWQQTWVEVVQVAGPMLLMKHSSEQSFHFWLGPWGCLRAWGLTLLNPSGATNGLPVHFMRDEARGHASRPITTCNRRAGTGMGRVNPSTRLLRFGSRIVKQATQKQVPPPHRLSCNLAWC